MPTGLPVFDTTIQVSNTWLGAVQRGLPPCSRPQAYGAVRAVLHVLRDRLPLEGVLGLSSQLPMLLRGVFFEGWKALEPSAIRSPEDFGRDVAAALPPDFPRDGRSTAVAVFAVMAEQLDAGEIRKLSGLLPAPLGVLWPATAAVARET